MSSVSLLNAITDISVTQGTDQTQFTLSKFSEQKNIVFDNSIGPKGDKGDRGANGPKGDRGADGADGPKGEDAGPIGTLVWLLSGNGTYTPDTKFVVADGSDILKSEYPVLFDVFGDKYGDPLSTNTFKLPDLRKLTVGELLEEGGDFFLCGGNDGGKGGVFRFNAATMAPPGLSFNGHSGNRIRAMRISHDGKFALSGANDTVVHKFDTRTMNSIQGLGPFTGPPGDLHAIGISRDDKFGFSGCTGNVVLKFDTETMNQVGPSFTGHSATVLECEPSIDDKFLFSSSANGVRKTNADTMVEVSESPFSAHGSRSVRASPDGKFLMSAGMDGTVRKIDTETMNQIGPTFSGHTHNQVYAVRLTSDGKFSISASQSGDVRKLDTATMTEVAGSPFTNTLNFTWSIAISPDDKFAYLGDNSRIIIKLDIETMSEVSRVSMPDNSRGFSVVISPRVFADVVQQDITPLILAR